MITSILDDDLYKFTMQNAVLQNYFHVRAGYQFINRSPSMRFNNGAFTEIERNVLAMRELEIQRDELAFLVDSCPYLDNGHDGNYIDFLRRYRYDPREVTLGMNSVGDLVVSIAGPWYSTILWEVPLLAIISEAYFKHVDTQWNYNYQENKIEYKAEILSRMLAAFSEFGTRRRRDYYTQDLVVGTLARLKPHNFFGTSNVHFAHKYNLRPVGTMAHEWIMGTSGILRSVIHANTFALHNWLHTYGDRAGYALTDTFGTKQFFREFNKDYAEIFVGVRHDSGDAYAFANATIAHYERLGIDPKTKIIIFSDSLDVHKAKDIARFCGDRIQCSFGIGTHFTNDFDRSKPMNIVIKLTSVNDTPVVKLSDDMSKATGDPQAIDKAIDEIQEVR